MAHLMEDMNNRIVSLIRKSDDKVFPAEVRAIPNRFLESMVGETITLAWQDSEDNFTNKSIVLTYDENSRWDWENDTFKCTFAIPDPQQEVAEQTPRGVPPIAVKGSATPILTTK